MSDVQIAVIDQQDTQIVLAVPGVQGATGSSIPSGGTVDQVLRKNSSTNYDAGWTQVTSAMIANGTIINEDVNNSAAIAGTKISPDFGGQAVSTTAQVNAARVNVTANTAPTNGLYLPASNTVGISTNGTGRLFVDASGSIGIGTSAIRSQVHLYGVNQDTANLADAGSREGFLRLSANSTAAGAGGAILFANVQGDGANSLGFAAIKGLLTDGSNNTAGDIAFSTRPTSTSTSFQERLRITSDGKAGLGTSSPNTKLHVSDGEFTISTGGNVADAGGVINFGISQLSTYSPMATVQGLLANSAGTELQGGLGFFTRPPGTAGQSLTRRMTITAAGNVGVGTTSPNSTLTVKGTARVQNTVAFVGINIQNDNDSSAVTTTSFFDASNNLGTIDGHLFFEHLTTGGSNARIATTPAGDRSTDRRVTRLTVNSAGTTTLNSGAGTPPFIAQINGAEQARIDSSGRLLVGTSSTLDTNYGTTGGLLQVTGTPLPVIFAAYTNDIYGGRLDFVKSRSTTTNGKTIVQNNDGLGTITWGGADGTNIIPSAQINAYVDGTPAYAATTLANGQTYRIVTVGNTDFTLIGASDNTVGTVFTATGPGTGTGTAILNAGNMPGRLVFSTTADGASIPTERMRISSDGLVTTEGGALLKSGAYIGAVTNTKLIDDASNGSGTTTLYIGNASIQVSSDIRLKDNIRDTQLDALTAISRIAVKDFTWNDPSDISHNNRNARGVWTGLIAQELVDILPFVVNAPRKEDDGSIDYDSENVWTLDQSQLCPVLIKAIQQQQALIDSLESRLSALEA